RPSGPTSAWSNYRTNPRRAAVSTAWVCRSEIVGASALVPWRRGERRVGAPRLRGQGARRRTGWRRALPTGVGRRRSDQLGLELDRGAGERLRHRAVRLGRLGLLLERRLVDPRHFRLGLELDARNGEAAALLLDVHGRYGVDALRGVAGRGQPRRERHREAAGMRRADQLFGIGAVAAFEPRAERIGTRIGAAPQAHLAVAAPQVAPPLGLCCPRNHDASPLLLADGGFPRRDTTWVRTRESTGRHIAAPLG